MQDWKQHAMTVGLLALFFLVMTPISLILRLMNRDPLKLKFKQGDNYPTILNKVKASAIKLPLPQFFKSKKKAASSSDNNDGSPSDTIYPMW